MCGGPDEDYDDEVDDTFTRSGDTSVRSGHRRRRRQANEEVCCKETNIKASCSKINHSHR